MKNLSIEETKSINGGVKNITCYKSWGIPMYWGAQCSYCGNEFVVWGGGSAAKAKAICKAHACEISCAEIWANRGWL